MSILSDHMGETWETLVQQELGRIESDINDNEDSRYANMSADEKMNYALDEAAARACQTILTDTDAIEQVAKDVKARNPKLFNKIAELLKQIVKRIRNAYKEMFLGSGNDTERQAREMLRTCEAIRDTWVRGALNAGQAMQTMQAEKNTADGGVRLATRSPDSLKRSFSWKELSKLPNIYGYGITNATQSKILKNGKIDETALNTMVFADCQSVAIKGEGTKYYLYSDDLGKNIEIFPKGIRHGYFANDGIKNASPSMIENAFAVSDLKNIVKNSVEVNVSYKGQNGEMPYKHVMIGVTAMQNANGGYDYYAVRTIIEERKNQGAVLTAANVLGRIHAVNAKKIATPKHQATSSAALPQGSLFEYKITDLLNDVKGDFRDTFSLDVYKHLKTTRIVNSETQMLRKASRNSDGEQLSVGQQNYFMNSKVRDADGNLLVMGVNRDGSY